MIKLVNKTPPQPSPQGGGSAAEQCEVPLPLFLNSDLNRLQERREALLKRIQSLRPHCHQRVGLQARLAQITAQQMRLEIALYGVQR